MLHVRLGQVLFLAPRALAGSKCPHCRQDSRGCSRIMAANARLPAAVRAGTDTPAAVTQQIKNKLRLIKPGCLGLSLPWAQHTHPPGVHPTDLVEFCLTQLGVGLMFSCDLCSLTTPAPAPCEGCCVVSEHGMPQPSCPAWL